MECECGQFVAERAERTRMLHERHERDLDHFDNESARLGFRSILSLYTIYVRTSQAYICIIPLKRDDCIGKLRLGIIMYCNSLIYLVGFEVGIAFFAFFLHIKYNDLLFHIAVVFLELIQ